MVDRSSASAGVASRAAAADRLAPAGAAAASRSRPTAELDGVGGRAGALRRRSATMAPTASMYDTLAAGADMPDRRRHASHLAWSTTLYTGNGHSGAQSPHVACL